MKTSCCNFVINMITSICTYFGRYRLILDRESNEPYLERYYLFLKDRESFPFNIFLHKFLKSDPDDLHDHPWNYRTIILSGGYWEHTEKGRKWKGPGSYIYAPAEHYHRVELAKDKNGNIINCWTLFMPGMRQRDWGFKKDGEWVQNEKYIKERTEMRNLDHDNHDNHDSD